MAVSVTFLINTGINILQEVNGKVFDTKEKAIGVVQEI